MKRILKWLEERLTMTHYLYNPIKDYKRYCTKCGKRYIVIASYGEGVFDCANGEEFVSYVVGCPSEHEKLYYSTNPKFHD